MISPFLLANIGHSRAYVTERQDGRERKTFGRDKRGRAITYVFVVIGCHEKRGVGPGPWSGFIFF